MICSSLNRLPFIRPSPFRDGLYLKPVGLAGCRPRISKTIHAGIARSVWQFDHVSSRTDIDKGYDDGVVLLMDETP